MTIPVVYECYINSIYLTSLTANLEFCSSDPIVVSVLFNKEFLDILKMYMGSCTKQTVTTCSILSSAELFQRILCFYEKKTPTKQNW